MALEDHLRLKLLIDGIIQVKPSSIRIHFAANNQVVETLEGLAGKTPGSGRVTITCTTAVGVGGPEHNWFKSVVRGSYHDCQVPFGPLSYIGTGWFDECDAGQSVGQNTEASFTWIGEFAEPT